MSAAAAQLEQQAETLARAFRVLCLHLVECHTCGSSLVSPGGPMVARTARCEMGAELIERWRAVHSVFWDARLAPRAGGAA